MVTARGFLAFFIFCLALTAASSIYKTALVLTSRRTIARLSLFYKFRNNLAYTDNDELHQVTYSSTRLSGHALKLPITRCDFISFPSSQEPYWNGTDCQDKKLWQNRLRPLGKIMLRFISSQFVYLLFLLLL